MNAVLTLISAGWNLASQLYDETARVRTAFATDEKIVSDDTVMVQSMLLLRAPSGVRRTQTKVLVQFYVRVLGVGTEIGWDVDVKTKVVYGEAFSEGKMRGILLQAIKSGEGRPGVGGWLEALSMLKGGLEKREVKNGG